MRHCSAIAGVAAMALLFAPAVVHAREKRDPDKLALTRVQDLHYGDVLFEFYMGEDLEALTRLEAYEHWHLLPHHEAEAELLAGGLYLQLGMHNEAGRRFESVLTADVPANVKSRAWFYLAKVWYARGYYERCVDSLHRIEGQLAPAEQAERIHLEANALMQLERYDDAVALLANWHSDSSWMQYARFNLGVALAREGRLNDAEPFLEAVGLLDSTDPEMLALRDKANVAQGFAWLQAGEPAHAQPILERVRLNGPQSSRALLGLGWALTALGRNEDALTPWMELRDRNLLDAAVQEAYLAVPYAFAQLGAGGQAADYYDKALTSFAEERGRIDKAIARVRGGNLTHELVGGDDIDSPQRGWFWQLQALPDEPESRYLYPILAGNDFQEGLKNYRDLAYLGSTLAHWDENMGVYDDMIATREKAYAERTPRADALLGSDSLKQLVARRQDVAGRINDVVNHEDVAILGTPQQREQWQHIGELEVDLLTQPQDEATAQLRDKLKLIKGVLYWDLREAYPERLYQQRRELKSLDKLLEDSQSLWLRVQEARKTAPTTTGDFAQRVTALQARLQALRTRLDAAGVAQENLLAGIAVNELTTQRQRIADYEVQARFALATIYDRAAEGAPVNGASAPAPAPGQGGAP
jgi:thioredoxin-like negative regulator of GroEL